MSIGKALPSVKQSLDCIVPSPCIYSRGSTCLHQCAPIQIELAGALVLRCLRRSGHCGNSREWLSLILNLRITDAGFVPMANWAPSKTRSKAYKPAYNSQHPASHPAVDRHPLVTLHPPKAQHLARSTWRQISDKTRREPSGDMPASMLPRRSDSAIYTWADQI